LFATKRFIVELKALTKVGEIEWAQVLNGHERGLLINFGAKSLERRRFIRKRQSNYTVDSREPTKALFERSHSKSKSSG
jgi:hypothetical protein